MTFMGDAFDCTYAYEGVDENIVGNPADAIGVKSKDYDGKKGLNGMDDQGPFRRVQDMGRTFNGLHFENMLHPLNDVIFEIQGIDIMVNFAHSTSRSKASTSG